MAESKPDVIGDLSAVAPGAGNESRRLLLFRLAQRDGLDEIAAELGWDERRIEELAADATLEWSADEVDGLLIYQKGKAGMPVSVRDETLHRASYVPAAVRSGSPERGHAVVVESVAKLPVSMSEAQVQRAPEPWDDMYRLLGVVRIRLLEPDVERRDLDAAQELILRLELALIVDYRQTVPTVGANWHGDRLWEEAQERGSRLRALRRRNSRGGWLRWLLGPEDLWKAELRLALRDMGPSVGRGRGWEPGLAARRLGLDAELRQLWR